MPDRAKKYAQSMTQIEVGYIRTSTQKKKKPPGIFPVAALPRRGIRHREESKTVLGRSGSDLLSQALRLSTISAEKINGRVRNGIGFRLLAKTTRPAENSFLKQASFVLLGCSLVSSCLFSQRNHPSSRAMDIDDESNQADRAISTGKLNTLLYLHTRPINVVVFHGSDRENSF